MIRRFLKYIVVFVLFVVATLNLSAQSGLNVKAPSSAYINEGFTVSYTIQCSGRPSNFDKPTVSGGRIISGPYQSQQHSTTIINGQVSSSSSYTFSIMILATQEGTVKLSPAQVKADGKVYTSQAVSIRVSNSHSAHSNQRQQYQNQHNQRQQSYYNQYQQQQPSSSSQSNEINIDNSALFIRAIPNKSQVVRGEEIVISYKLYTLVPVSEYSIQTIPSTNGFWVEELDQQANPTLSIEEVNGQRYQVATLRKVIVYPQRTGRLTIPGLNVNILAHIATHSRQSFTTGDPFFDRFLSDPMFSRLATSYQKVQKDLKTNAITIQVNELPQPQP
ncbi:MAG: BatD family protein, partial [Bacteroidales bacterium]|nr:BatD family protein [Bacteroidales bacterium]